MAEEFSGQLEYEGEPDGVDRRRAPRKDSKFDLTFTVKALPDEKTLIETLDKILTAQSRDVSMSGISMWTNRMLVPGTTIGMEFPIPSGGNAITVTAKVVWCQPHTKGGYVRSHMGLEFVDISPEAEAQLLSLASG